jgi:mevalonate kinase
MLTSSAHAKLILAGEHAVIYGSPAITTRLNWQTRCYLSLSDTNQLRLTDNLLMCWTRETLNLHWKTLNARHQQWKIQTDNAILQNLSDLPLAVLAWWQQHYPLPTLTCTIESQIPLGQGLGSSASLIVAILRGLVQLTNTSLTLPEMQTAATTLENLAHGKSSGLDVAAILIADRMHWQAGIAQSLAHFPLTGYLIDTGKANSNTADCVGYVHHHWHNNQSLWHGFSQQVTRLESALLTNNHQQQQQAVSSIHRNLCQIGVVPQRVQRFAETAYNDYGWAGKLCGAGSIAGDGGGFFWLLANSEPTALCAHYGYDYWLLSSLTELAQ